MWLKDPTTGSVTLTVFITGFLICTAKLLLSGIKTDIITFEQFSGVDYAAALAALGGIYVMRKNRTVPKKDKDVNDGSQS